MTASVADIVGAALAEMDRLVDEARRRDHDPEELVESFRDLLRTIVGAGVVAEDSDLSRAMVEYLENPTLAGVGRLGNGLVRYRAAVKEHLASRPA